jgi:hypothetical protein
VDRQAARLRLPGPLPTLDLVEVHYNEVLASELERRAGVAFFRGSREELIGVSGRTLKAAGIDTGVHYRILLHRQPANAYVPEHAARESAGSGTGCGSDCEPSVVS